MKTAFKVLINHSNYSSEKWPEEQKRGWDKIIDLPLPEIDPELDTCELDDIALETYKKSGKLLQGNLQKTEMQYSRYVAGRIFLLLSTIRQNQKAFFSCCSNRKEMEVSIIQLR